MGVKKTILCFLSGEPARNLEDDYPGYSYTVRLDGQERLIRLKPEQLATDHWLRHNRERLLEKLVSNNHWHLLERGWGLADLQDYLVAPANYYS